MRCKQCGEKWSLESQIGLGGEASPGQYSSVAIAVFIGATAVGWYWNWLGCALLSIVGSLVFFHGTGRVRIPRIIYGDSRLSVPKVWPQELDMALALLG
jgi:hypothetical protein